MRPLGKSMADLMGEARAADPPDVARHASHAGAAPGAPSPQDALSEGPWEQWMAAERASLRRVAAAVVTGEDPTAALCLAAREAAALMHAEQGFVFRFQGDRVVIAGVHGVEASPIGATHEMLDRGVIPLVFGSGAPARVEGVLRPLGRENSRQYWISPVYRGGIGAPVFVGEELWGALVAGTTRDEPFPDGAEERLAYFAEIAGIAIGNAEANARLAQLAMSDPLTGLANHRTFHSALAAEAERARRHRRRLALAVIDVNHFKAVNDLHGHMAGDRVLVEVARRLSAASRSGDILARVGGEEFAWIIPEAGIEGALAVADRARCAVGDTPIAGVGPVTVSIGIAELLPGGTVVDTSTAGRTTRSTRPSAPAGTAPGCTTTRPPGRAAPTRAWRRRRRSWRGRWPA